MKLFASLDAKDRRLMWICLALVQALSRHEEFFFAAVKAGAGNA